jgi:hypothetical protein|tara:strand:- start:17013 stop:17384 length:372 start_codon:yes stop_codon:yes gene_type:complete
VTKGTFEEQVISDLVARDIPHEYEPEKLSYYVERNYIPDLRVGTMIVELKGYFRQDSQRKMKAVKAQHPELDIRFVFQKASSTIQGAKKRKDGSKMTCQQWADRNGFIWAEQTIPKEWLNECD